MMQVNSSINFMIWRRS